MQVPRLFALAATIAILAVAGTSFAGLETPGGQMSAARQSIISISALAKLPSGTTPAIRLTDLKVSWVDTTPPTRWWQAYKTAVYGETASALLPYGALHTVTIAYTAREEWSLNQRYTIRLRAEGQGIIFAPNALTAFTLLRRDQGPQSLKSSIHSAIGSSGSCSVPTPLVAELVLTNTNRASADYGKESILQTARLALQPSCQK